MIDLGIFVGENGKWSFLHDLYADWNTQYKTQVFQPKTYHAPLFAGRLNRWAYQQAMRTLLQQSDVCFFDWASELLAPASHLPKKSPMIARLHSYELFVWAPKINWDNVDKVIFISQHMQQKFNALYPQHAHKGEVVYNAVDLNKFKPPACRAYQLKLGMLCNIHPVKRIYETVLVLYGLKQQGYEAHLFIAGGRWPDGYFDDYYVAIQRLIEKLGLQANVTFEGPVQDTPTWLQKIDIFISNSYWEGLQVALLEAMAAGCYCLAHGWDGAEEALPSTHLFMTDAELQQKIIEYVHCPETTKATLHAEMRAIACEKFDAEQQKAEIRRIIEGLAVSKRPQPGAPQPTPVFREVEQG